MGQRESSMVDDDTPTQTLRDRSLESIARYITEKQPRNIVVMTGAGISTSAGIPDFRSPETGLYANLARLNLPHAEAVFDISYFRENPNPFYALAQELYPGQFRPTITHVFISLLHKKGLLLKLFTQNIDCLEREAGVPDDKIVEAHGSFARQSCIDCKIPYPKDLMQSAIRSKTVPHCVSPTCDGLVKPEIVFFGEQLPSAFFENRDLISSADLCIVMGTSLTVHPFAGLPALCEDGVPRLLINKEQAGDLGSRADDVLVLEDCDGGIRKLAEACGWLEELEDMWAKTGATEGVAEKGSAEAKKSLYETLQDEVDKLTQDVERTLQMSDAQVKWYEDKHGKLAPEEEGTDSTTATGAVSESKEQDSHDQNPNPNPSPPLAKEVLSSDASLNSWNAEPEGGGARGGGGGSLAHVFPHLSQKP